MVLVIRSDSEIAKSINRSKLIRVQKQVMIPRERDSILPKRYLASHFKVFRQRIL